MMGGENSDSANIMGLVPEGSTGAEIGVWKGKTSKMFLERNPGRLYLVDPWSVDPYRDGRGGFESFEAYLKNYSKLVGGKTEEEFQALYDAVFSTVTRKLGGDPRVVVCRMTSDVFFERELKEPLDWVYVDGDHSEEGTYKDLGNAWEAVKAGGFVMGDDYRYRDTFWGKEGVTAAVRRFCAEKKVGMKRFGEIQWVVGKPV